MAADIHFPLNETQLALLKLSENISEEEMQDLKRLIIAFKARRLAQLADKVWDEKGWSQGNHGHLFEYPHAYAL